MKTDYITYISYLTETCYDKGYKISYRKFYGIDSNLRRTTETHHVMNTADIRRACEANILNVSKPLIPVLAYSEKPMFVTFKKGGYCEK